MGRCAIGPVVVCIPARDEIERLPRLLRSLAAQAGFSPGRPLRVLVVANNCTDGTSEAAHAWDRLPHFDLRVIEAELTPDRAHVGTARKIALDAGADWICEDGRDGILLTTDADAECPATWIAANVAALAASEIVGGRLVIRPDRGPDHGLDEAVHSLNDRIERYWRAVRQLEDRLDPPQYDPAPRHGDHTGASLALRSSTYRRVGGLPPLRRGEDNALVARVQEAGGRLRHCPRVHVLVSDREVGRAEGGMACEMLRRQSVARGGADYLLPAPAHWQAILLRRAELRGAWLAGRRAAETLLLSLGLNPCEAALGECVNDIAFVERASGLLDVRAPSARSIPLDEALAGFDRLFRERDIAA